MVVTRAYVDWWKARFSERIGNPYVYAGTYSPTNTRQGCDCSALAAHLMNGVLFGPAMTWQRVDPTRGNAWITTESWRPIEVGQRGPFGTITVASPRDIPDNAAVKIALHHGPGGGAASHMWLECDGMRMESAGSKGSCTAPQAWPIDHSYGNDWAYLPGPIEGGPSELPPEPVRIWGIDISNHQGDMDIAQVRREEFDFLWAKVTEGNHYKDPYWPRNRDLARENDLLLAGYHYVRSNVSAPSQADNLEQHIGDKSIPVMLDFEEGSGNIDVFWAVKKEIEKRGMKVRLSYIPDWYWERIGRPDLSQVPGLIASEYVTGTNYASTLYPGDNWHGWKAYGGRTPDILQFTSSARVAGLTVDAMAYRDTRENLERLLHGLPPDEGEDMTQYPSRSIYRDPDSKFRETQAGYVLNIDAMMHREMIERLAVTYHDPDAVSRVLAVAQGRGAEPNNADTIEHAKRVLQKIPFEVLEKNA